MTATLTTPHTPDAGAASDSWVSARRLSSCGATWGSIPTARFDPVAVCDRDPAVAGNAAA